MGTENHQTEITDETGNNCKTLNYCSNPTDKSNAVENNNLTRTNSDDVPFIPITVDEHNVIDGAKEILKVIRSDWNIDEIQFKLFTDGITNKLVGCFNNGTINTPNNEHDDSGISSSINDSQEDVVLVRVYGNNTELLIDRKAETRNIRLLHTYGFAPSLFGVFKNGLAYEYVPGCTLTPQTIIQPKIWTLIAQRMAEMHKVQTNCSPQKNYEPMLWKKSQKFFDLIPEKFSDDKKHQRLCSTFLPVSKLRKDFENLYSRLVKLDSPVVFCHNDLLLGNVVYTESLNRITFIDYEYAAYNFQGFDIGNHFTEFAGIDEIDYSRYPSKEFQMEWLRVYLESYLETENVPKEAIERLYVQANQFALASHFFWAIWALIQAEHSTIDFDFVKFAHMRYGEYLAKKEQFLDLKL